MKVFASFLIPLLFNTSYAVDDMSSFNKMREIEKARFREIEKKEALMKADEDKNIKQKNEQDQLKKIEQEKERIARNELAKQRAEKDKSIDCQKIRRIQNYCGQQQFIYFRNKQIENEKEVSRRTGFMTVGGSATITQATRAIMMHEKFAQEHNEAYKTFTGRELKIEDCGIQDKVDEYGYPLVTPKIKEYIQKLCGNP